jgi:rhodanese-related sulfurtransferase
MSAPFAPAEAFSSGTGLALAVIIGFAFGFVLERAGFGSSRRLAAQFYLYDMTVFKVMFTAIVTAMVGLFGLARIGWVNLDMVWVNPTFLWPQIVGGFLLGAGFIISGYCPGTCIVASASGKVDGLLTLVGVFGGIGLFAVADGPAMQAFHASGSHGRLLLSGLLGIDPLLLAIGVAVMAAAAFIGAEAVERRFAGRAAPGRESRRSPRVVLATIGAVALAGVLFFLHPAHTPSPPTTEEPRREIAPIELARHLVEGNGNWTIVDLRDLDAVAKGSIPQSVPVPASALEAAAGWSDRLNPQRLIVLVDAGDGAARRIRIPEPYRAAILAGGFPAWTSEILTPPRPVLPGGDETLASYRERAALVSFFTGAAAPAARAPAAAPPAMGGGGKKAKAAGGCS